MNILLVEDDVEMARMLADRFREQGHAVEHVGDGTQGLSQARAGDHQVIVLDRMLPGLSGLEFVKALRQFNVATPVIFLTTMAGIDDRVSGLEAGADDYLVKPFAFEELLARVRVLARRSAVSATRLHAGAIEIDLLERWASRDGRTLDLLPQEFRLLEYLVRNANRVVTRKMLLESVWDIHFDPHTSIVESHISRLRAKLNLGFDVDVVHTVRGVGYKLIAPV